MRWIYFIHRGDLLIECMDGRELGRGRLYYHLPDGTGAFAEKDKWSKKFVEKVTLEERAKAQNERITSSLVELVFSKKLMTQVSMS